MGSKASKADNGEQRQRYTTLNDDDTDSDKDDEASAESQETFSLTATLARFFLPLFGRSRNGAAKTPAPPLTQAERETAAAVISRHLIEVSVRYDAMREKRRAYLRKQEECERRKEPVQAERFKRIVAMIQAAEVTLLDTMSHFENLQGLLEKTEITQMTALAFFQINKTMQKSIMETIKNTGGMEELGADFSQTMQQLEEVTAQLDQFHEDVNVAQNVRTIADEDLEDQLDAMRAEDEEQKERQQPQSRQSRGVPAPAPSSSSVTYAAPVASAAPVPREGKKFKGKKALLFGDS